MPRTRPNLSLNTIWDLEDEYTALAGSASGRTAASAPAKTAVMPAAKTITPKRITRTQRAVHAVTEGIKAGLAKTGISKLSVKTHGAPASKAKKQKFAPAPAKSKVR